ncbi:uncharacterized protein LOC127854114 [Dreissena polymorpha]|nr:uncharacterized protein LOC127854114 [Dreissena polymorpha]XP_052245075.1 uncharacterized protein LOC127854114 [Dreissena polymorpha]
MTSVAGVQTARPVKRPSTVPTATGNQTGIFCTCKSVKLEKRTPAPTTPRAATPCFHDDSATWCGFDTSNPAYRDLIHHWYLRGMHWIACSDGQMPSRPVQGGHTRSGEPLYIARTLNPVMKLCIGTFRPSTGFCSIEWRGRQYQSDHYEMLCYRSKLQSRATATSGPFPSDLLAETLKVQSFKSPLRIANITYHRT